MCAVAVCGSGAALAAAALDGSLFIWELAPQPRLMFQVQGRLARHLVL